MKYNTKQWVDFRKKNINKYCYFCGNNNHLVLHHISYKDYWNPQYVITLCGKCNYRMHRSHTKRFYSKSQKMERRFGMFKKVWEKKGEKLNQELDKEFEAIVS